MTDELPDLQEIDLYAGWAGSVIWMSLIGPIDYGDAGISIDLAKEMTAWEAAHYANLNEDYEVISEGVKARLFEAGVGLARRLSDELGSEFRINVNVGVNGASFSSSGAGTNPHAVAAFRTIVRTEQERQRKSQAIGRMRGTWRLVATRAEHPRSDGA